jgi:hypothetical protein
VRRKAKAETHCAPLTEPAKEDSPANLIVIFLRSSFLPESDLPDNTLLDYGQTLLYLFHIILLLVSALLALS